MSVNKGLDEYGEQSDTLRRVCDNILHNVTVQLQLQLNFDRPYYDMLRHDRYSWELGPSDVSVVGATYLFFNLLHRFI